MKARAVVCGLLIAASCAAPSAAAAGGNGSTAFDFLSIPIGPRQMAMGGSGVAIADDLFGANINPAALGRLWRREFSLLHTRWMDDVNYQYLGYAHTTSKLGTFAGSFYQLSYGDIPGYDASGARTGALQAQDRMAQLSYGTRLRDRFWAGTNVKYMQERLHTKTAGAAAGDAGLVYQLPARAGIPDTSLGLAIRNLGTRPKFEEEADLPRVIQGGVAVRPFFEGLTVSADITKELAAAPSAQLGFEYLAKNVAAFRAGYNTAYAMGTGLSVGVGIKAWDVQVDYAFAAFSTLGSAHHFGLTFRFGSQAEQHYDRGMQAFRQNDFARAIVEFGRAISLDGRHRRALLMLREANAALQTQSEQLKP